VRALPVTLRIAVLLLFAEAAGVAAVAVVFAYDGLTQKATSTGAAVSVVVFPAGLAVLLALLGWHLIRLRSWARGPTIALELLLLPLGYSMVVGGAAWLGVPAIVAGLACTGLLVAPASRQALGIR
jgi:hypothetical protein